MTEHETHPEEESMPDTGLGEERALVEPVAVGPGDVAGNGHDADGLEDGAAPAGHAGDRIDGADGADGARAVPGQAAVPPGADASLLSSADASLLSLVDRLTAVLERGDLGELEVSSGGTTIILRAPSAVPHPVAVAAAIPLQDAGSVVAAPSTAEPEAAPVAQAPAAKPSVKAPLTGIYYGAPSPGATPYVAVGDHVSVGQIIGLIEAMKLFNEIKSDLAGRVVRLCVDSGALVKAKQPLIEVEPA